MRPSQRANTSTPTARRASLVLTATLLVSSFAWGLPEDEQQPLEIQSSSNEMFLDLGYFIYRGTQAQPAVATQGSMKISGVEIIVERGADGIAKVTATGSPARFQQQPEANQAIVHARGKVLVFDNVSRLVTADEEAEFDQGGNTLSGHHIEYDMQTRRVSASGLDGQPVNMFFPPLPPSTPAQPAAPATEE